MTNQLLCVTIFKFSELHNIPMSAVTELVNQVSVILTADTCPVPDVPEPNDWLSQPYTD